METTHEIHIDDARDLDGLSDESVELVVTSPPYPMIEMWDEVFGTLDPDITRALEAGDGHAAFEGMHAILDQVWTELGRVLVEGGIACVNVGDATRTVGDSFRVYHNHARVIQAFVERGFHPLPEIIWRKPTNSAAKFMGSGMLPPNAYVTLEHEYILPFRKGSQPRSFVANDRNRQAAAYFWEERNEWFSDLWTDITGTGQSLAHDRARERSGAFPPEIPYRLINMYSVYDDTVLDPFWGTGTTSLAAMAAARNSVGVEIDPDIAAVFDSRVDQIRSYASDRTAERLASHRAFVERRQSSGDELTYQAEEYDFPVMTRQERSITLYGVDEVSRTDAGYVADHVQL